MFGKFLGEYEVGERWVSGGRTVTEADLVGFSGLSGDFFPLHVDEEYSKGTRFGRRIAHGFLVFSIGTGLWEMNEESVLAFYGVDRLRFVIPTFIDDTIHLDCQVLDVRERGDGRGILTIRQEVKKHTGETAAVAEVKMLLASGPATTQIADRHTSASDPIDAGPTKS